MRGTSKEVPSSAVDHMRCYDILFDNYRVPTEVTAMILKYARLGPIVRRSREIEREKLVCWKEWYECGILKYECNWKDGKRHGVLKRWCEDGTLEYERNWKDGKEHGVHKWWYKDGTLEYECNWKDGKEHGVQKRWHEDGTLMCERNWKEARGSERVG